MAMRTFDVDRLGRFEEGELAGHLLPGERIDAAYGGERGTILFTDRRIVTIQLLVLINERLETVSYSYRAVRSFALNAPVDGAGRTELKIALDSDEHPLHLRANPGTDFAPVVELLAARLA